jgi:hypothetical protein
MNQREPTQNVRNLFVGLAIVILATMAIIVILGSPFTIGASNIHAPGVVTSRQKNSVTPGAPVTQTVAFLMTQKSIVITTDSVVTRRPYITPVIPPTGIYENERTKYSGIKFEMAVKNSWFGLVGGNRVTIYAGALLDDPSQGAIMLHLMLPNRSYFERVLTPVKQGALQVVDEHNNRLTLATADGATTYFDVPARRFVTTLTGDIPTATLPPPYASTPGIPVSPGIPYP